MGSKKKGAKVSKIKAQAKVESVHAVGMVVNPGVDPEAVAAYEARSEKKTETVVTVNQEKFNRSGMDALMNSGLGITAAAAAVEVTPEKKTVRARINDGFLGMTRKMYRAGKNGQEILEANRDARLAAGYTAEKALIRAKKDYGYVVREAKTEKKAEAPAPVEAAVANG